MALVGDSLGFAIGLQGKPESYSGIYERGIARRDAQEAAKKKAEDENWRKYLDDIKVDPKIYHTSQIGSVSERTAKTLDKLQNMRLTQPNTWMNQAEREVENLKLENARDAIKAQNLRAFEIIPDAQKDPFQRDMTQAIKTSRSTDEIVQKYLNDPRSKSPDSGVTMDTDPSSPTYGTVGMNAHNPNINLTDELTKLVNSDDFQTQIKISQSPAKFGTYSDVVTRETPDKKARELFGVYFDQNQDAQLQYRINNRYTNPEKLRDLRTNFIEDAMRLKGKKISATTQNIPENKDIDFGSQSQSGKVNYAVSEKKGDEILGSHRPDAQIKTGAKIRTDDTFTVVDFARNDATKNKPIVLDNSSNKPVIVIPRKMIKNNRTGKISVVGIKTERVDGWESVVGEPEGEIIEVPYDNNREALAVEMDKLTWEYAMKHGKKGEVQTKTDGDKKPKLTW